MLVEAGADINATDNEGKTALIYTLAEQRTETAKYLIEKGADVNIADNSGHKAIDYATAFGLRDIIALLGNADTSDVAGNTPLHQAVYNGQTEVVRTLANQQNVNAVNDGGETPLLIACMQGNLAVVNILLRAGADTKLRLLNGNTALHYAASQGNRFIGKQLLDSNAEVDAQNENGETALIVAAMCGQNDFSAMLIENNANVNLADNEQQTALSYASERGFTEIVEQLIIAGAEG